MGDHFTIEAASGIWTVRAGGAVLVESQRALRVSEADRAPVIYFPRDDVAMAFLERSEKVTTCPWRGQATHYSIVTKSTVLENAAWSFEDPKLGMERIAGHLAFHTSELVTVEEI